VTDPGALLPRLAALPDQEVALAELQGAWLQATDRPAFTEVVRGALAYPDPHPMVPLVLRLASVAPDLDVEVELQALWQAWADLDLRTRQALAGAVARRLHRSDAWLERFKDRVLSRPELGERLVPLFLAAPHWFAEHAGPILAAYPHAKPAIAAAGQLLLERVGVSEESAPASSESRELLGKLLDYDATEVFDKLHVMLDAAPELGEPLILEMAARKMDLRGVIVALRDRVDRDRIKGWLQAAVTDELELLVYMAMV